MENITKKELDHLAELSRLEIRDKDSQKLEHKLSEILAYFNELKEVNTDEVLPLTSGVNLVNSTREDIEERSKDTGNGKEQFPKSDNGYLSVPSVF